jgi:hypothetical protein
MESWENRRSVHEQRDPRPYAIQEPLLLAAGDHAVLSSAVEA